MTQVSIPMYFAGTYDRDAVYMRGDFILHEGKMYMSNYDKNKGNDPAASVRWCGIDSVERGIGFKVNFQKKEYVYEIVKSKSPAPVAVVRFFVKKWNRESKHWSAEVKQGDKVLLYREDVVPGELNAEKLWQEVEEKRKAGHA